MGVRWLAMALQEKTAKTRRREEGHGFFASSRLRGFLIGLGCCMTVQAEEGVAHHLQQAQQHMVQAQQLLEAADQAQTVAAQQEVLVALDAALDALAREQASNSSQGSSSSASSAPGAAGPGQQATAGEAPEVDQVAQPEQPAGQVDETRHVADQFRVLLPPRLRARMRQSMQEVVDPFHVQATRDFFEAMSRMTGEGE